MQDVYNNIEECNPSRKCNVFEDMIADMISNKKRSPIVTELFIRGQKLNISTVITQHYFQAPNNVRLNSTHFFIMKIPNKQEL